MSQTSATRVVPSMGNPALDAAARTLARDRTRFEAFTRPATDLLVLGIGSAREIVDLASGTGDPALALAAAQPSARVLALDCAAPLLAEAAREASARGLSNLRTLEADMHALPLSAASVDYITSRLGIQFAHDAQRVLSEIYRVLQPGGVTCHVVWGAPQQPLLQAIAVQRYATGEPGPFQFSVPGSLARALVGAGFADVEERTHHNAWVWPGDARSFWQFMHETSAAALQHDGMDDALARLERFEHNGTLVVPCEVHCARARTA